MIDLTLNVWRQSGPDKPGRMERYEAHGVNEHSSFLEMLLNQHLIQREEDPIAFDHDCREGICGSCGFVINGEAHGPLPHTTVCQLHMRHFRNGDTLTLEPWRSKAFPVVKDLMVDRSAFDRIVQSAAAPVSRNARTERRSSFSHSSLDGANSGAAHRTHRPGDEVDLEN